MRSCRVGALGLFAVAVFSGPGALAQAPPAGSPLQLTAGSADRGWISFAVRGPAGATVELREQIGQRRPLVARIALPGGTGELRHAAPWSCDRRRRHFIATSPSAGAATTTVSTAITTPSCKDRLRMIVAPGRLRPGQSANVRVSDTWQRGGLSASVCARSASASAGCRSARLRSGQPRLRARLALRSAGSWTIALRTPYGQRLERRVVVRRGARVRVLVTGDSLTYGIFESMTDPLRTRGATVYGDPHPATAISTAVLDWPAHARKSARTVRPDATIVFLGGAVDGFPLRTPMGLIAQCCDPMWVAEYARRVRGMMASYLRGGSGVVYWLLLPAPENPARVANFNAINSAIALAAGRFGEGVRVVGEIADVLAPNNEFRRTIVYRGQPRVVRQPDGVHLATYGVRIAASILLRMLRSDRIVP